MKTPKNKQTPRTQKRAPSLRDPHIAFLILTAPVLYTGCNQDGVQAVEVADVVRQSGREGTVSKGSANPAQAGVDGREGDVYYNTQTGSYYRYTSGKWEALAQTSSTQPEIRIKVEQALSGCDASGGYTYTYYVDTNDNGALDSGEEIKSTSTLCNNNKGDAGSRQLNGSTDPDASLASSTGDYYLNTVSGDYFEKKATGWEKISNLKGPQGQQGTAGAGGSFNTNSITAGAGISVSPSGGGVNVSVSQIPITNGGTGATSATQALSNLGGLPLSGGSLTGALTLIGTPTAPLHAATKQYVDDQISLIPQGVTSFNTRAGNVMLTPQDVTDALGYQPARMFELMGDVNAFMGGSFVLTTVTSVGGVSAYSIGEGATLANQATPLSTASTIVKRDSSGDFSAGTITANLTGNVIGSASLNVLKTGDTMTGALTLSADPTSNLEAATKQYVDSKTSTATPEATANTLVKRNQNGDIKARIVTARGVDIDALDSLTVRGDAWNETDAGTASIHFKPPTDLATDLGWDLSNGLPVVSIKSLHDPSDPSKNGFLFRRQSFQSDTTSWDQLSLLSITSSGLSVGSGQISGVSYNAGAGATTFDMNNGNTQYTSLSTCGTLSVTNVKDGATYTIAVQGVTTGTCLISVPGSSTLYNPVNTSVSSDVIYTFIKIGSKIYVSWSTGYQ